MVRGFGERNEAPGYTPRKRRKCEETAMDKTPGEIKPERLLEIGAEVAKQARPHVIPNVTLDS